MNMKMMPANLLVHICRKTHDQTLSDILFLSYLISVLKYHNTNKNCVKIIFPEKVYWLVLKAQSYYYTVFIVSKFENFVT